MLALGGFVRGGLYGTAASLAPDPQNPTLENSAGDVHYETDFRSVYAKVSTIGSGPTRWRCWAATSRKPASISYESLRTLPRLTILEGKCHGKTSSRDHLSTLRSAERENHRAVRGASGSLPPLRRLR